MPKPNRFWSSRKGEGEAFKWIEAHKSHSEDACLIWPFFRDPYYGRGRMSYKGRAGWAHRFMCEQAHGPSPSEEHQAAHNCGNGSGGCVNPKHLEWKTNSQNQLDRRVHGTQAGAKGNRTRFTPQQIAQIRQLKGRIPQLALAELLGCKRGTIEYWQNSTHAPTPPGTSRTAIKRRQLKAAKF